MTTDKPESIRSLDSAAELYATLGHFFLKEPTPDELQEFEGGTAGQLLKGMGYDVMQGLENMGTAEREQAVAVEYCRLFIGPGPHLSPHESVLIGQGAHWGEKTQDVYSAYAEAGFDLEPEVREMPDHIGVELEFMSTLLRTEVDCRRKRKSAAGKKAREQRRRFLEQHLLQWVPAFAEQVAERSEIAFYRELSRFTKDWIQIESGQEGRKV